MMNTVLDSTRFLVENPQYVFIYRDNLEETATKWAAEKLEIPAWTLPVFMGGKSREVIDFFFLGNTINFCYTDFATKKKFEAEYNGAKWSGATGMWACLKRAIEDKFPFLLEGKFLKGISEGEMKRIFEGNIIIPMFEERLHIFREAGQVLCDKYDGRFSNLADASNHMLFNNGRGLVERLTADFPSFNDSLIYEGKLVRFDKRAQLAPAMTCGRFQGDNDFFMRDINELTVFADYVLPKGLRTLGILSYEGSLAVRVDHQIPIEKHSREELEIRASTIHACKMLADKINRIKGDGSANALSIDNKLWSETRKVPGNHHLTYTIDY
ncbi:hypothetical protein JW756_03470 [Candidatus Woesearchaeota archaeon]|nr:hypothetical protein [Candidatus Woesearchaeota archaeon]